MANQSLPLVKIGSPCIPTLKKACLLATGSGNLDGTPNRRLELMNPSGRSGWDPEKMKLAHFRTIAIVALCFMASASAALAANYDFANSDRIALELARPNNLPSLIDENFTDMTSFAGTLTEPAGTPAAVFQDLCTPLESRVFLQNRTYEIRLEALNSLSVAGANAPVPEPSSLITAFVCGCAVLLGLQRLRRKRV